MLVSEYLDFIVRLREIPTAQRRGAIDRAVMKTGVESVFYRPIGQLSKGFRQRVGLAQAIVHEPDLLVLDEPTEGLDPNQRVEIRRLIGDVGRDRTVILSTHVLPEVQHTCSRLLIISRGKLVADGPVSQLVARAQGLQQITVEASGAAVAEGLRALPGVTRVDDLGGQDGRTRAAVTATGDVDLRPAIYRLAVERGWTLYELYQAGGSLEELFRQLTTEGGRA
jgi:ABC-2 type transport system ATP-binding protein